MKRFITILLTVCMALSATVPVFAISKDIREAGTVDKLVDTSIMQGYQNIAFLKDGGVLAKGEGPGVLVYKSPKVIRSLNIYTEAQNSQVKLSASEDGNEYQSIYASASNGKISSNTVPGQNLYLRIEFENGVKISKVEINTTDNFGNVTKKGKVLIDYFEDFSKMHSYTPGLKIDTDASKEVGDDYSLMLGSAPDKANIVYKVNEEISAFKLLKYCGWSPRSNGTESILKFYLSKDGSAWDELEVAASTLPNDGLMAESQEVFDVAPGYYYLKIEWNGAQQNWSPRLGTLEIYYGPQPAGSIKTFQEEINDRLYQESLNESLENMATPNPKGMEFVTVPTVGDVIQAFEAHNPVQNEHPRLLANKDDFDRVRDNLDKEPYETWFQNVKERSDLILTQAPSEFILQNRELIVVCREVKDRILRLGMMWQMTGEEKYAERAWKELEAVCNFPNWNPQHYLDVGEMTFGVSIGYDWFYDYWSPERKKILKDAILKFGINTSMPFMRTRTGNTQSTNNWNGVCNGGVGTGAVVLFEEEPELCAEYISIAIEVMPKAIAEMYPDGVYPEGLTYWDFGTRYTVYFMTGLDYLLGTDYGLSNVEGFSESGDFILYASTPTFQTFTFSDAGGQVDGPQLYWMAKKFNKPQYAYFQMAATGDKGDALDMIWYDADYYATPWELDMPLDRFFDGDEGVVSFRSSWEDKNALYFAAKAGDNQSSHGDLDIGTFILESDGFRWAVELSAEDYNSPGYWDNTATDDSGRWKYYKKRAEGQNTLVINPDEYGGQNVLAKDKIEKFETGDGGGYAIIDMSNAYDKNATSAKRGVKMYGGRSKILVQDELNLKNSSEVYWFMQAAGDIEIINGGKAAIMTSGARKMKVSLLTDGAIEIMKREPLPLSPVTTSVNNGNKLAIHLQNVKDTTIAVVFEPVYDDEIISQRDTTAVVPLASWSADDVKIATLDSLSLDGIQMENFKPDRFIYTVQLPKGITEPVPVQGTSSMGDVTVKQAQVIDGKAIVEVQSNDPAVANGKYTIIFEKFTLLDVPEDTPHYQVVNVTASDEPQPENSAKNSIDGRLDTRWSAEGEPWIQYDLGEEVQLGAVTLGIFNGDTRKQIFDIQLSSDGENWNTVLRTESSGTTQEREIFRFERTPARYVRIQTHGTDSGTWNSITEFDAYDEIIIKRSFTDIETHWAKNHIEDMAYAGVVEGKSALIFEPDAMVTRAEFAAMLVRALGLTKNGYNGAYSDVAAGDWFAADVQTAKDYGIITDAMMVNGGFAPNTPIDRETMAAMSALAAQYKGVQAEPSAYVFPDAAQISSWAADLVQYAVGAGVIAGDSDGSMKPKDNATRAQAVVVIKKVLEL